MKIRFLSNYDIAKNLINIILDSAKFSQQKAEKQISHINNAANKTPVADTFVKTAEKAGK